MLNQSTSDGLIRSMAISRGSGSRDPGVGIRDPGVGIRDPGVGIRDPGVDGSTQLGAARSVVGG